MRREAIGEALGTFIIVFIGCGAVGAAVILGALTSLFQVAFVFGFGVTLAILASRNLCPAHLNPAVSLAMVLAGKMSAKKLPIYILAQFIGAFCGAALLYLLFNDSISALELKEGITRGSEASIATAMMFGEFFPNPGFAESVSISWPKAMFVEALGTFILVLVIFKLVEKEKQVDNLTPLFIGLTVVLLICLLAPFTQGGFNPARDFAPRLFAYFAGWGEAAFPAPSFSFFTVYILGPLIGGVIAAKAAELLGVNNELQK